MHRSFNPVAPLFCCCCFCFCFVLFFGAVTQIVAPFLPSVLQIMRIMMFWKCIQRMLVATLFVTVKI